MLCRDEDYALALVDGAFTKAIVVQLVRKIEGKQFYEVSAPPELSSELQVETLDVLAAEHHQGE